MNQLYQNILKGYQKFRKKYVYSQTEGQVSRMHQLSVEGQSPKVMFVACCDSRVDPGVLLQCHPGDLFITRNVANIVPPYEQGKGYHGTSAALEFGVRHLKVKHLIVLGHSQCGGIESVKSPDPSSDFLFPWTSILREQLPSTEGPTDKVAKDALKISHKNLLSFPWIRERVQDKELRLHLWFFEIKKGAIFTYDPQKGYLPLEEAEEASSAWL